MREKRERRFSLAVLAPAWIFLIVLIGYPLIKVLIDTFSNSHLLNSAISGFAGLGNFERVIADPHFSLAVKNTVLWTVLSVAGELIVGLGAALLLNAGLKGQGFYRILVFLPWLVPIIVAGMTWDWMLNPDFGIINSTLVNLGLISEPINFLGNTDTALWTVIFVNIWRSFPYYTISFLAALQAIPGEVLEAASLDGARGIRKFKDVVFPYLRSTTLIIVFIHLIWTAVNFDFIWVMTQGGPNYSTVTVPILIYQYSMQKFDVGAASALSTLMLVATSLLFVFYYRMKNRLSEEIVGN
ncbi:sugar ABC transporter permease [Jonesiaceae bacterium BS-20]|uniref:Sugar ABC transporter permease n=1 Tax=Jonesiaceae bacterium BS-20 TaxID=3120821 RepID=A0AAU7DT22_9MICO